MSPSSNRCKHVTFRTVYKSYLSHKILNTINQVKQDNLNKYAISDDKTSVKKMSSKVSRGISLLTLVFLNKLQRSRNKNKLFISFYPLKPSSKQIINSIFYILEQMTIFIKGK